MRSPGRGAHAPRAGGAHASRRQLLLVVGGLSCLAVLALQMSVFAGGRTAEAPSAALPLVTAALLSVRALLSVPSAPFQCEPVAAGSPAVLCESSQMRPAWADVVEACSSKQLGNGTASRTRLLVMRAPAWLALRAEAYQRGFVEGSVTSSLLPVNTTLLPWAALPGVHSEAAMWAMRLLTAMAWQYEGRFDVMLNGTAVCRLARALKARGPAGSAARAGLARALVPPGAHTIGVAARELASSSFWEFVWTRASGGAGASISVSWCARRGLEAATAALCARTWLSPEGVAAGLESAQASYFTRNASMVLHDRSEAARLIPLSHARVADNVQLLHGTRGDNHTLVNVAFNPPDTMALAGRYLQAFDMVVTPSGGLQSRTGRGATRAVAAACNGTGVRPRRFLFHTTCEPEKLDQYPDKLIDSLPVYNEVVVITHRLEYNIYHWTTESMGKLAALLDYIHGHPHVRIHVGLVSKKKSRDALFRHEHLKLLGLRWRKRVVSGYVRARVVHYADNHMCGYPHGQWVQLLRERYRAALGLDNPPLMLDRAPGQPLLARLAPPPPGRRARSAVAAATATTSTAGPAPDRRKQVVVLRRGFSRRIANEDVLLRRLRAAMPDVRVREIRDWQMPSQEEVFRRLGSADAIIGPHGAGQTNAIVARPGTCLMEFIPTDWFVLCYWRMSGHLDLDYNQFIAPGDRYAPMTIGVSRALVALRACMGLPPVNLTAAIAAEVNVRVAAPAAALDAGKSRSRGGSGGGGKTAASDAKEAASGNGGKAASGGTGRGVRSGSGGGGSSGGGAKKKPAGADVSPSAKKDGGGGAPKVASAAVGVSALKAAPGAGGASSSREAKGGGGGVAATTAAGAAGGAGRSSSSSSSSSSPSRRLQLPTKPTKKASAAATATPTTSGSRAPPQKPAAVPVTNNATAPAAAAATKRAASLS